MLVFILLILVLSVVIFFIWSFTFFSMITIVSMNSLVQWYNPPLSTMWHQSLLFSVNGSVWCSSGSLSNSCNSISRVFLCGRFLIVTFRIRALIMYPLIYLMAPCWWVQLHQCHYSLVCLFFWMCEEYVDTFCRLYDNEELVYRHMILVD